MIRFGRSILVPRTSIRGFRSNAVCNAHSQGSASDRTPFEKLFYDHKLLKSLLESYTALHGHLYIPISYVQNQPHYGDEFSNIKLGKFAYFVRTEMKSKPKLFMQR